MAATISCLDPALIAIIWRLLLPLLGGFYDLCAAGDVFLQLLFRQSAGRQHFKSMQSIVHGRKADGMQQLSIDKW